MTELPPSVSLSIGEGGLPTVEVSGARSSATVYLHGANVTSWVPAGQAPVLWLSPESLFQDGEPIRGGIPLCLPWFSKGPSGEMLPMHGTARLSRWTLDSASESDGVAKLVLTLDHGDYAATYTVSVGDELGLELTTTNTGEADLLLEEAMHTYFNVQDVAGIKVRGLDGATYLDKVSGEAAAVQEGDLVFTDRTDRVYDSAADVEIVDPRRNRTIAIAKTNSANTVTWNPWAETAKALADVPDEAWPGFVCVETANVGERGTTLAPGESHTIATVFSVLS